MKDINMTDSIYKELLQHPSRLIRLMVIKAESEYITQRTMRLNTDLTNLNLLKHDLHSPSFLTEIVIELINVHDTDEVINLSNLSLEAIIKLFDIIQHHRLNQYTIYELQNFCLKVRVGDDIITLGYNNNELVMVGMNITAHIIMAYRVMCTQLQTKDSIAVHLTDMRPSYISNNIRYYLVELFRLYSSTVTLSSDRKQLYHILDYIQNDIRVVERINGNDVTLTAILKFLLNVSEVVYEIDVFDSSISDLDKIEWQEKCNQSYQILMSTLKSEELL